MSTTTILPLQKPPGYRDPPRPLPASFHRHERRKCRCCRTLLIATLILTLILSAACTILYIWFQPRLPQIRVKYVSITSSSNSRMITTRLQIQNPNRNLKMVYGKSRVSLRGVHKDRGAVLGEGKVLGFTQETNNVTALEIRTKEIRSGVGVEGNEENGWSTGIILKVKLVCEAVRILSRPPDIVGKESKCRIRILDDHWFYAE